MTFSFCSKNLQTQIGHINEYFDECRELSQPIRVSCLAEHLGIDQSFLAVGRNGECPDYLPHEIEMALLKIEHDMIQRGLLGDKPELAMRDLVENYGYVE